MAMTTRRASTRKPPLASSSAKASSRGDVAKPPAPGASGLIARGREASHLEQLLTEARRGRAGIVILRGEPGVGKRSLIEFAAGSASEFSVIQLSGRPGKDDPTRWDWPEPIAGLLELARSDGPDEGVADAKSILIRATEAVEKLAVAASAPLLLSIDHCQELPLIVTQSLADAISMTLANEPIALILSFTEIPGSRPLTMPKVSHAEHRLQGLTLEQGAELLGMRGLSESHQAVYRKIHGATRGNPAALIDAYGSLSDDEKAGFRSLPDPFDLSDPSVRGFGAPLDDLGLEASVVVATACAARSSLDVVLRALTSLRISKEVVASLSEQGLIRVHGKRIDLIHPLLGIAAYVRLEPSVRQDLHEALAQTFLDLDQIERSAIHASRYALAPDARAARLFGQAARSALDQGEASAAARHHERAAELAGRDEVFIRHFLQAAAIWTGQGNYDRAENLITRALEQEPNNEMMAEAIYQRARARAGLGAPSDAVVGEMRKAARLCESRDPTRAGLMLSDALCRAYFCGMEVGDLLDQLRSLARLSESGPSELLSVTAAAIDYLRGSRAAATTPLWSSSGVGAESDAIPSGQCAFAVGIGLLQAGETAEMNHWYEWIDASARNTGDKSLVAVVPLLEALACLRWGSFQEAAEKVEIALDLAGEIDESCLVAHALAVLVDANVASGSYASCFEAAAQLFAMSPATGSTAKGRAFVGLALLELQGDRPIASLNWLRALGEEAAATKSADGPDAVSSVAGLGALDAATAIILSGAPFDAGAGILSESLLEEFQNAAVELDSSLDLDHPDELLAATASLHSAAEDMQGAPFLQAKVWLCLGGLLARGARHEQARRLFDDARTQFGAIEAAGWVSLCDREIKLLSKPSGDRLSYVPVHTDEHRAVHPSDDSSGEFVWEIRMLGAFSIQSEGKKVTLPLSLSAQTLKIVALRESIPVDELVEHLWPEAEPGVGSRRLRNVLWRLRSTCGELITRQDNLICLAPETVTDVGLFRRKAEQALDPSTSMERVLVLARDALRVYAGDLLPGDRYADWAEIPRESLQRLHIRLLEVLIDDAERNDRTAEALSLTEQMIDDDPYNEEHYMRAATFHAKTGSPRTAVAMLVRAERMLSELGVAPSPSMEKMRQTMGDL